MRKYILLLSGVAVQLVLGSIYAWSELAILFSSEASLSSAQTQSIYGVSIAVFAAGTIVTGRLLKRFGPRFMTICSALLFVSAYLLGSFLATYAGLLISLGVILGFAIACGYVVPLSTSISWFPHMKATVTGLAVMGFGGGAIVASWLIRMLSGLSLPVFQILRWIGFIGAFILFLAALFQRYPDSHRSSVSAEIPKNQTMSELFRSVDFWCLYVTMFLATLGGLIIIGSIGSIGLELRMHEFAALGVSVLAIGNSSGRLIWGAILDRFGTTSILLSLIMMTGGFLLILFSAGSPVLFIAGVFLCGFQFGASLVLYAGFTESRFGSGAISTVYPLIFSAYGLAALLGPAFGGWLFDLLGSYNILLILMSLLPLAGFVVFSLRFLVPNGKQVKAEGNV